MKYLLIAFLFIAQLLNAQAPVEFIVDPRDTTVARLNIRTVSEITPDTYLAGVSFTDYTNHSVITDITEGLIVWDINCNKWYIYDIGALSGSVLPIYLERLSGVDDPAIGIAGLCYESDEYLFPIVASGIPDNIKQCMEEDFKLKLQTVLDGIGTLPPDIISGTGIADRLAYFSDVNEISPTTIEYSSTQLIASTLTGSFRLATGTTAQRPGTPVIGDTRLNSTLGDFEFYNGGQWRSVLEGMFNTGTPGELAIFNSSGVVTDTSFSALLAAATGLTGTGTIHYIPRFTATGPPSALGNSIIQQNAAGTAVGIGTTPTYTFSIASGGFYITPQSAAIAQTLGAIYVDSDDSRWHIGNGTVFQPIVTGTGVANYIPHWDAAGNQAADGVARIVSSEVRLGDAPTVDKGAYSTQITGDFFIGGTSTNPNMTYSGSGNALNSTFSLQTSGTFTSSEALYATNNAASGGVAEFVATSGSNNLRLENSSSSASTPAIIASHNATGVHTILRADTRNAWGHCCGQTNQDNIWDFNFEAYRSGSGWSVQGQSNAAKIRVGNLGGVYLATDDYDSYFDFQVRRDSILTTGLFVSGGDATGIGGMFGVGIFDSTPSATLDVGGNTRIQTIPEGTPTYMSISAESDHDVVRRAFAYGEMHIQDTDPDTVAITAGSPAECTDWSSLVAQNFTFSAGRLTYTGTETARFLLDSSISATHSVSGAKIKTWLYYNNSKQQKTGSYATIENAGEWSVVSPRGTLTLATNDYIEVFFDSDQTGDIRVEQANLTITKL
jgi:hypothetical protein